MSRGTEKMLASGSSSGLASTNDMDHGVPVLVLIGPDEGHDNSCLAVSERTRVCGARLVVAVWESLVRSTQGGYKRAARLLEPVIYMRPTSLLQQLQPADLAS